MWNPYIVSAFLSWSTQHRHHQRNTIQVDFLGPASLMLEYVKVRHPDAALGHITDLTPNPRSWRYKPVLSVWIKLFKYRHK